MLFPIETWSAACCCPSTCISCSTVTACSSSRCSSHIKGNAIAVLWPCSRRANSATNSLSIAGAERVMSAITSTRLWGSFSPASIMRSAQTLACSR